MTERQIVFPIGHYAGQRPGDIHQVRLGWSAESLTEDEFSMWVLAHGSPRAGKADWTTDDLLTLAAGSDVTDPEPVLTALRDRRLLALVPTAPAAAPETLDFVGGHRIAALLTGIGDTAEQPGRYAVGIPGTTAVTWLDPDAYELWQWGPLAPTLWHLAEARSAVAAELGEPTGPREMLSPLLADLRLLLASSCAYLDPATTGPGVP